MEFHFGQRKARSCAPTPNRCAFLVRNFRVPKMLGVVREQRRAIASLARAILFGLCASWHRGFIGPSTANGAHPPSRSSRRCHSAPSARLALRKGKLLRNAMSTTSPDRCSSRHGTRVPSRPRRDNTHTPDRWYHRYSHFHNRLKSSPPLRTASLTLRIICGG